MDRAAWWAPVHGVARVEHNLATKPPSNRDLLYSTGNYIKYLIKKKKDSAGTSSSRKPSCSGKAGSCAPSLHSACLPEPRLVTKMV